MGTVYRARDTRLGRQVAIKIQHLELDETALARFRREAEVLGEIHHPHVVQAVQVQDGRLVAYSLGNFRFDQQGYSDRGRGNTAQGLALRAFFDRDGLRAVQALPIQAGLQPRLLSPKEGALLLAQIAPPPSRLAFTCDGQRCRPVPACGR